MRHRKKTVILGRSKSVRKALFKSQAISLITYKKITTTTAKAKALRPIIEKLITTAKVKNLASFRKINQALNNSKATEKLFTLVNSQSLKAKTSGYTRLTKLNRRQGDGAEMSQIEIL